MHLHLRLHLHHTNRLARQLVKELLPHCDVLVENFRPGRMEEWGLGMLPRCTAANAVVVQLKW